MPLLRMGREVFVDRDGRLRGIPDAQQPVARGRLEAIRLSGKAGKRAVIGCEHRRIFLYRSPVVGRVVVSEDGLVGIARETDARPKPADGSGRSNCMENFSPD